MKIGFICTNYNNSSYTRAAVASLHAADAGNDVRIVVVDNKSNDDDVARLKDVAREFPKTEVVLNPANVGYFPGLNIGIERLRERFPEVDYVVIGNNDLVFPETFVETMQCQRHVLDKWAVIAPDLVTAAGVHQIPHVLYPISRARQLVWELHFLSYRVAVIIASAARITERFTARKERVPGSDLYKTACPIEWGFGACYILGPTFFSSFRRLWAPTFLMGEEFFLAEQVKSIDQRVFYDPQFVVFHHDHATTDRLPSRRQWEFLRISHRLYKRYLAMPAAERHSLIMGESQRPA